MLCSGAVKLIDSKWLSHCLLKLSQVIDRVKLVRVGVHPSKFRMARKVLSIDVVGIEHHVVKMRKHNDVILQTGRALHQIRF